MRRHRERAMGRARPEQRGGPSIREFLRYYVLVLLDEKPFSARNLRRALRRRSRENQQFRPSGVLLASARDLRLVLQQLSRQGLIEQSGDEWCLTGSGRERLRAYEESKDANGTGKERAARKLLSLMGTARPGESTLDVGTGEGFLAFQLADKGYRVLGIDSGSFDYSKESIQSARSKAQSCGGQVEFRKTSVADLAVTRASFDYVVTSQAMHCMKDQRQCLDAICRLLKPGGTFLCMDFLVGLEGFLHHGWHCLLAISREEWRRLLPQRGFEEPDCHKAGDYLVVRARRQLNGQCGPC
jgi:ubiquinone/menaquinone biosynthesis C-methylase UbiE